MSNLKKWILRNELTIKLASSQNCPWGPFQRKRLPCQGSKKDPIDLIAQTQRRATLHQESHSSLLDDDVDLMREVAEESWSETGGASKEWCCDG
jgi:hypothetical protein